MTRLQDFARRYRRAVHLALGVGAVGLLLWGRLILKEAPRTATADGPAVAQTSPAPENTVPITTDKRFSDVKQGKLGGDVDQGSSRGKSDPQGSDDFGQMQAAPPAAAELTLQGVITGKVPVARINGRLIRVGDTIEGFTLSSLEGRYAVLEKGGQTFRLTTGP